MTKEEILQMINTYIVENNTGAITAAKLKELLSDITNIIADSGIVYKGEVVSSNLPQTPQEGDTYRMIVGGLIGNLRVYADDLITYRNGAWTTFAKGYDVSYVEATAGVSFSTISDIMSSNKTVMYRLKNGDNREYHLLQQVQNPGEPLQYGYYTTDVISSPYSDKIINRVKHYISQQSNTFTTTVIQSVHVPSVIDNVTSASTTDALSANMGKELQDQINNLKARGRYLSVWNCTTGLAETEPTVDPYEYKAGDYFIVGIVGTGTKYKPSGATYSASTPSTAIETGVVKANDNYYYDGSTWHLMSAEQMIITFASIAGNPNDNTALANALNAKENISNKVTAIDENATDVQYSSARAVFRVVREQLYTKIQADEKFATKANTLTGYNITDAYTKSQIDGTVTHIPATQSTLYLGGSSYKNCTVVCESRSSNLNIYTNPATDDYSQNYFIVITNSNLSINWYTSIKWNNSPLTTLLANRRYFIHFIEVDGIRYASYREYSL